MPAADSPVSKEGACLSSLEIGQLASAVMESAQAQRALQHVTGCEDCGRRLLEAKEDFERPMDREEERLLAGVKQGVAEAATPERRAAGARWQKWWSIAAAAVVLSAVGVWWATERSPSRRLASGLQASYLAGRPFEFRLDLPGYGPQRQQKGR